MALTDYSVKDLLLCIEEVEEEKEQLKKENKKLKQDLIEVCIHEEMLVKENEKLKANNKIVGDELTYFKERCEDLEDKVVTLKKQYDEFYEKEYLKRIDECNKLWGELFDIKHMSLWEFANKYCNDEQLEEAGKTFARSLLGGA